MQQNYGANTQPGYGAQAGYGNDMNAPAAGHQNTPGREGIADKIANAIPGHTTGAPGSMPGSNNPSAHDQAGHHSHTGAHSTHGAGYGSSATGPGYGNNTTTPAAAYGAPNTGAGYGAGPGAGAYDNTGSHGLIGSQQHGHATGALGSHGAHGTHATHGAHGDAPGAGLQGSGREGMADKVANAMPGHNTGAPGSMPGSNNPKEPHGAHATHGTHASTTGTHTTGTGLAGAHDTHHDSTAHGTHGTHGTHGSTTHGTHGATTADGAHKPSMGEKIGGKLESMIGKATKNEQKVAEGEAKAAGLDPAGTHAAGTTANRY